MRVSDRKDKGWRMKGRRIKPGGVGNLRGTAEPGHEGRGRKVNPAEPGACVARQSPATRGNCQAHRFTSRGKVKFSHGFATPGLGFCHYKWLPREASGGFFVLRPLSFFLYPSFPVATGSSVEGTIVGSSASGKAGCRASGRMRTSDS